MNKYITRVQVKDSEEEYNIKDSESIKSIIIKTDGIEKELTPVDGTVTISIPTTQRASSTLAGVIKIPANSDNTSIDDDGFLIVSVPLKSIKDPEGNKYEIEDSSVTLKAASDSEYGMVKVGNGNIVINETGFIHAQFGSGEDIFTNILEENDDIDFASLFSEFSEN